LLVTGISKTTFSGDRICDKSFMKQIIRVYAAVQ
jgi:hypothetical protein